MIEHPQTKKVAHGGDLVAWIAQQVLQGDNTEQAERQFDEQLVKLIDARIKHALKQAGRKLPNGAGPL